MRRSSAELLAEAKKEEQDTPVKEPWVLVLSNGREVTFRDPQNVSIETVEGADGTLAGRFRTLLSPQDFRAFWREWGKVEQRYVLALVQEIIDYYSSDDSYQGKDNSKDS